MSWHIQHDKPSVPIKKIKHFHIRKTGGTAINEMFKASKFGSIYTHTHGRYLEDPGKDVFTFTILRDPCERVLSHYNMFKWHIEMDPECLKPERSMGMDENLGNFLYGAPNLDICAQLYKFSQEFNVDEAVENILSLSTVLFTEDLADGRRRLENMLGDILPRVERHHTAPKKYPTDERDMQHLIERVAPEYGLIEKVKANAGYLSEALHRD